MALNFDTFCFSLSSVDSCWCVSLIASYRVFFFLYKEKWRSLPRILLPFLSVSQCNGKGCSVNARRALCVGRNKSLRMGHFVRWKGMGWSMPRSGITRWKEKRCPLYRTPGGPPGLPTSVRNISPPPIFELRAIHPVANRYHSVQRTWKKKRNNLYNNKLQRTYSNKIGCILARINQTASRNSATTFLRRFNDRDYLKR